MIAVAARGSSPADVAAFTRQRLGGAPVDVYIDSTGAIARAFGVSAHPDYRFVSSRGRLTTRVPSGFPFS